MQLQDMHMFGLRPDIATLNAVPEAQDGKPCKTVLTKQNLEKQLNKRVRCPGLAYKLQVVPLL